MSAKRNIIGNKFGRYTVISEYGKSKSNGFTWLCKCDCGNERVVRSGDLISGSSKSCGCLKRQICRDVNIKHGMNNTSEYNARSAMIQRCTNPKAKAYKNYGGRGITICDRWLESFENFFEDMGLKPAPHLTLERRNNNLGYNKDNCYWGTSKEQAFNRRSTIILEYMGIVKNQADWAKSLNIEPGYIGIMRKRGKPFDKIVEYYATKRNIAISELLNTKVLNPLPNK